MTESAAPPADLPAHLEPIAAAFESFRFERSLGDDVALLDRDDLTGAMEALAEAGFDQFVDLTVVDFLDRRPRYELVIHVASTSQNRRLRVKVGLGADDPQAPSLVAIYPGANFFEREAYDMFGISFAGHPDLTRILMPDDWEGHPLRKDYPVGTVPVQFRDSPKLT